MATVVPCVSIIRALTGEVILVRVTSLWRQFATEDLMRVEARRVIGITCALGGIAAVLIFFTAVIWIEARVPLLCATVTVFAATIQDSMRHVCLTLKHSWSLVTGDGLVLFLSVAGILWVGANNLGPGAMILAWGFACAVSSVTTMLLENLVPSLGQGMSWLKSVWPSSSAFVMESVLGAIAGYLIIVALGMLASPADVAGYRATISVFGITSLVINFLRTAVLRELTQEKVSHARERGRLFMIMSGLVLAASLATLIVVLVVPDHWGEAAFGGTWSWVVAFAPFAALTRTSAGLSIVPLIFLRVLGVTWSATKIRMKLLLPLCVLAPASAALGGAPGAFLADAAFYTSVTLALGLLLRSRPGNDPTKISVSGD
ncbi:hypothetical protein [Kocuria flava]|uniref:hypothetical protein n=1 Tax=Kocuria flava TaxID=446860 RepID=UPI0015DFE847|nr:hypothetical protein [Kocuria flava]